jgi:hypothetical protein
MNVTVKYKTQPHFVRNEEQRTFENVDSANMDGPFLRIMRISDGLTVNIALDQIEEWSKTE